MGKTKLTDKRKRELLHELLDAVIDCNGFEARSQEETGNKPTVFFEFMGHIAQAGVRIYPKGWNEKPGNALEEGARLGDYERCFPPEINCTEEKLREMINLLKENTPKGAATPE